MLEKKKIPCRVCGTMFEPCSTCQSDNRMFRWRNFACSLRCAEKYINDTIAYRESKRQKNASMDVNIETTLERTDIERVIEHVATPKRKYTKKKSENNFEIVNKESEQID